MNIVQVIPHYVPSYRFGGPLQVAHSLAKALVRRGHTLTVCTTNLSDSFDDLSFPTDQPIDVDGVTVYYEPVPCLKKWGFSPVLDSRVNQLISVADYVLIHNYYQYSGLVAGIHARRHRKPYILFPHASLQKHSIRSSNGFVKRLYLATLERKNLLNATHIAFNAPEELTSSLYSHNGVVIPNAISSEEFLSLPSKGSFRCKYQLSDKLIFLFLGRLDINQKGLDILITAFAKHVFSGSESVLVLAGPSEGTDCEVLRSLVAHFGLTGRVIFTGLLSGIEKFQLLRDADIFFLPSRYEGLSISLLEAMASGLPIVLSDRCGLHSEIRSERCGIVIDPSVNSLVSAMATMEVPKNRVFYGNNARRIALEKYTWTRVAASLDDLMQLSLSND